MPNYCEDCHKILPDGSYVEGNDFDTCCCKQQQDRRNDDNSLERERERIFGLVTVAEILINNGNYEEGIPRMAEAVRGSQGEIYYDELVNQIQRVLPPEAVERLNKLLHVEKISSKPKPLKPNQPRSSTPIDKPTDKIWRNLKMAELNLYDAEEAIREGDAHEMKMLHSHIDEDVTSIEAELRQALRASDEDLTEFRNQVKSRLKGF